ncbi:MAG: tetratricopeptide repeat protein [Betaproteobacteria bacterium]|nr:tetratricopeptide repeat protein [Betaproteobacteria bacterium]NBO44804.1 tetratricopeptide repeat protein [Betaproteobacteria bacterium]NBP11064.1 tetratricopeptide repeat protein [Betaproteobacteria bacterium]NBQ09060.1 tetratricopeptide repeat protein [Betaproteobacteria bacterium]NBQ80961.1 tetratricopeptide repeat protein [Betaproteobacteria bacterium]
MEKGFHAFNQASPRKRLEESQALIEEGFKLQQQGHFESASARFEAALVLSPGHPTALQLLGLIAKHQGDLARARSLMQRSLQTNPKQAHVWNNLSNIYLESGDVTASLHAIDEALRHDQTYLDARLNRARLRIRLGQYALAQHDVAFGLEQAGVEAPKFLQLQAQLLNHEDRSTEALCCLDKALALSAHDGLLHHDRAVTLHRLGRYNEALEAHDGARRLGVHHALSEYNIANTYQALGKLEQAQSAYVRACELDPTNVLAQVDLARFRWRQADSSWDATIVSALSKAGRSNANLHGAYGQLLWASGNILGALNAWRCAASLDAGNAHWRDAIGRAMVRAGDVKQGLQKQQAVLDQDPSNPVFQASLATSLLIAGDIQAANHHVQKTRDLLPEDQYAWALQELCWRALDEGKHRWLCDLDRLLHVYDLHPPGGWKDLESFHRDLAAELISLHHDSREPLDQTLRQGTQTIDNLFDKPLPCVKALEHESRKIIEQFLLDLPDDKAHPFLGRKNRHFRFKTSWSNRLFWDGFHTNHVHPAGWLSLVYYVEVPDVCLEPTGKQGWLQFGRPEAAMPSIFQTLKEVQPRVGRLVLFPSYFWHGTYPFQANTNRIAISADIVPATT